jgi:cob(I)alamin adenosyltransferase
MMRSIYSRTGDDGTTGLLGEGRVQKFDARMEALGAVDEATAALGLARNFTHLEETKELLLKIQRHLYGLMAEAAATPENAASFRVIDAEQVSWLEVEADTLTQTVPFPREFIVPGDSLSGAYLDLARTIVRRAERRLAELLHRGDIENVELLRYLNRLSSLLFMLELRENQSLGTERPTLAKDTE